MQTANRLSWMWCICAAGMLGLSPINLSGAEKAQPATKDQADFHFPAGQRQLFLDDVGIANIEGLERTMHRAEKKGAVIRVDYITNPKFTMQTRTAPVWDPDKKVYKFWVSGVGENAGYMESPDGLSWTAGPQMNMGVSMAVRDPNDPDPARRYKTAWGNGGFGVSADGIQWTKLDVPPVPSQDESNFSYNSTEGLFIHTVKRGGPHGRAVALATSADFKTWKDHGLVFHADEKDQEIGIERIKQRLADPTLKQTEHDVPSTYSVEVYNLGVFRYEGLYIGMPSIYHHTGKVPPDWPGFKKMHLSPYIQDCVSKYGDYTGFYNIQLVCSRTMMLNSWKRLGDRQPFIETSRLDAGAYDTQTIIGPSNAVVHGDELWFYYTGIKQYAFISSGAEPGYDDYYPDKGAICLAVLRRDGFVSLDAKNQPGTVLTAPFQAPADKLFVNVSGGKDGQLGVEVLGAGGEVLAVSEPVIGDQAHGQVKWQQGKQPALSGQLISLRFTVRNGSFYSYWLE